MRFQHLTHLMLRIRVSADLEGWKFCNTLRGFLGKDLDRINVPRLESLLVYDANDKTSAKLVFPTSWSPLGLFLC
jgi:hypothetical protein